MLMRETSLFMRYYMRKEMRWSPNRSLCLTGRGTLLRKYGPVNVWHDFCVDETHNVIYALALDEENGYKLVHICSD